MKYSADKMRRQVAVIATGWVGDTIACSAAATSLFEEKGYDVHLYIKWPQLLSILNNDARYSTKLYKDTRLGRMLLWHQLQQYDLIIKEPKTWSYTEPLTMEIRRLAGCSPLSEYELKVPSTPASLAKGKKTITVSRDIYKRAYGRNIDELITKLETIYHIEWIGLNPTQDSKTGRATDLLPVAQTMLRSDGYFGPEGGMLWLAAGLGIRTFYLTEHIQQVHPIHPSGDPWKCLGSQNMFPRGNHVALPSFCSNDDAFASIRNALGD